ncbi:MAG: TadE/TadG family type IV pilus assembly protein [Pseudomonadota bacterium]
MPNVQTKNCPLFNPSGSRRLKTLLRDLRVCREGVTAVEFSIIAPVFFALIFCLFELSLIFLRSSSLDNALSASSRLVYTGQTPTQDELERALCDRVLFMSNCRENITIEISVVSNFLAPPDNELPCRDSENTSFSPAVRYDTVGSAQIAFMRVCLSTPIIAPGVGLGLSLPKTDTDKYQIISSTAFLSEPF